MRGSCAARSGSGCTPRPAPSRRPRAASLRPRAAPRSGHPLVLWRVEVLATPAWPDTCVRCRRLTPHDSTGKFRVNANGERHDVWLLYRCRDCGETKKRRLAQRRLASELPGGAPLAAYLENDAALARRHAFAFEPAPREALPYRVHRPPLPASGALAAHIAQTEPSGARWDRFLAQELGWTRSRVARAAACGALVLPDAGALSRPVRDGQCFVLGA